MNSKTVEPNRPQWNRPAACAIAQQYSSANFVLLLSHSRKEKFGDLKLHYFNFSFKKCVDLKLRKLSSVLFSSVTHSRTSSTYILRSGEKPNFTPITSGKIIFLYAL
jgi:hypothetical protein